MKVKLLSITIYDETGWRWRSEDTLNPTWEQIETSIKQLNRFQHPFINLHLDSQAGETGYLSVVGGNGVYSLSAATNDAFSNYFDATKSDNDVDVWTSDQGYYPEEKYVCYDLGLVLKVAYYYAQFGQLSSAVTWQ